MTADVIREYWTYPLEYGDTLASHDWVELHIHRLLTSRFIAHAIAEGRREDIGTALILWAESFRQDPAGTLPDDNVQLAKLAGYGSDVEAWLRARKGALYGFRETHIEGEAPDDLPRLGHTLIAEIAERMHRRKSSRAQGRVAQRLAVAKSRIKAKMEKMGHKRLAAQPQVVGSVAEWLDTASLFITGENITAALTELGVPRVVAGTVGIGGLSGR